MNPNDIRFQDAIPQMPQSFYARMQTTMEGMEEPMKKRYKLTGVLIAAIVAALLLAGAAFAAMQSELLQGLFGANTPSEAEKLLTQDALTDEKEGVKLTVKEHLYDGRNFHLNWDVESTRDDTVYYLLNYTMRYPDGTPVEISRWSNWYSSLGQGSDALTALNLTLDGKTGAKRHSGSASNGFMVGEAPTEPWVCTIEVEVYTTDLTPVAMDMTEWIPEDEVKELSENRQIAIEDGKYGYIHQYPEYLAVFGDPFYIYGHPTHPDVVRARVDAHNNCGLLKPIAHLNVSINLNPSVAQGVKIAKLAEPTVLQFKDVSIEIQSLEINLSGSDMAYDVPRYKGVDDYFYLTNDFVIVDPDGTSVGLKLEAGSSTYYYGKMADGTLSWHIEIGGQPISKLPSELRFIRIPAAMRIPYHTSSAEGVLAYLAEHPEERDEAVLTLTIE